MLESSGKDELRVKIDGIKKFIGIAGVQGGNKAIQITRALTSGG